MHNIRIKWNVLGRGVPKRPLTRLVRAGAARRVIRGYGLNLLTYLRVNQGKVEGNEGRQGLAATNDEAPDSSRLVMNIVISPFTIGWYEQVVHLWEQCEGIGLSGADAKENIESYLERNPDMSFVATTGDILVGAVLGGHDGRRGYIHHLAVHPDYRRQGVGRQLVDRCVQVLREAGIQKCHIFIYNKNTGGIAFWKAAGWTHRSDICVISKTIEPGTGGAC